MFRAAGRLLRLTIIAIITLLALLWLSTSTLFRVQAQTAIAAEPSLTADPLMVNPVIWSVLAAPIHPVQSTDGNIHLIYGLHVSNTSRYDVRLNSIEVLDGQENPITGTSKVVSTDGQDLTGKVRPFSLPQPTQDAADFTDRLGPGQNGIVDFDVAYSQLHDVPRYLKHRITTSFQSANQPLQTYIAIDPGTE